MTSIGKRLASLTEEQLTAFAREFELTKGELRRLTEPVAIIGMSCRFPGGAEDPEAFWAALRGESDLAEAVPDDREWGTGVPSSGYFLPQPFRFDAALFGISPREARAIDPQHRMLLELAWQALESAGYPPPVMSGARCGVFAGCYADDFAQQLVWSGEVGAVDAHTSTGTSHSVGAGRVAHQFNLKGPAICFDTACSSSLVAVHSACEALRSGECDFALSGGVSLSLTAATSLALERARMLSGDGRSKAFDRDADGYARGEGGGLVLLRRLSAALRDGDPILAVILGSAVNHNGRTSSLTAPSSEAQSDVIGRALRKAGLTPDAVDVVECFAAGSPLGDAIEVAALRRVFADRAPAGQPLVVGSVKSNIGHLEAASGIASLIKLILSMRNGEVPANLHVHNPNPALANEESWLSVASRPRSWPRRGDRRIAGVSSFGFGGTNAHLVLGSDPDEPASKWQADEQTVPGLALAVSARTAEGVALQARAYGEALRSEGAALIDLCRTVNSGRVHHRCRALIPAETAAQALAGLDRLARDGDPSAICAADHKQPPLLFMFVGQGAQFAGMGQALSERIPSFREALQRCDAILAPRMDYSLADLFWGSNQHLLGQTEYAQPALFAYNFAYATMLMKMGVVPAGLVGHSLGEYVAAQLAGVFDLDTALQLVVDRGKLMGRLPEGGAMAAMAVSEERALELARHAGVDLAAVNGPQQCVLSGEERAIDALLNRSGVAGVRLDVSHAFHSRLMQPVLADLARRLGECRFGLPTMPIYSNVTGGREEHELATAGYWLRHLREPVRFADGCAAALADGHRQFVEIGPRSTLAAVARSLVGPDVTVHAAPGSGDRLLADLSALLGACYELGHPVDWSELQAAFGGRRVYLPATRLAGEPLRNPLSLAGERRLARALEETRCPSLAGKRTLVPGSDIALYQTMVSSRLEAVAQHRLRGKAILPAGYFVAAAAQIGAEILGEGPWGLFGVHCAEPLAIADGEERELVTVADRHGDELRIDIFSRCRPDEQSLRHAGLRAGRLGATIQETRPSLPSGSEAIDDFYERMRCSGYELGPGFRWLADVQSGSGIASARMIRPFDAAGDPHRHPGFFDSCFQLLAAAASSLGSATGVGEVLVPAAIDEVVIWPLGTADLRAVAAIDRTLSTPDTLVGQVHVFDAQDRSCVTINGFCARRLKVDALDKLVRAPTPVAAARSGRDVATAARPRWHSDDVDRERRRILSLPAAKRRDALAALLSDELSRILDLAPGELDPARSLHAIGVDSMMALELKTMLERSLSVHLPVVEFLRGPSLLNLTDAVLARIVDEQTVAPAKAGNVDVELLSDSQVTALLAELMEGGRS